MLFLRLHIPDRLKNTKLTELNVVDVQRSINAVKQSRTRVDVFNFYHGSLATAYKLRLTPYNLADMLVKPKHERNDVLVKNTSSDHGSFYSWLAFEKRDRFLRRVNGVSIS